MRKIILASTSPRRRELLERACIDFVVESPEYEEDMRQKLPARELVLTLALGKAGAVAPHHDDAIIIAADTVVATEDHVWSKPESEREARNMLRTLSGKMHDVWTGYVVMDTKTGKRVTGAMRTRVTLRTLSGREIRSYVATGEPFDGAGAYKLQGRGGFAVDSVSGNYTNILGLPVERVRAALRRLGVEA